MAIVEYGPGAAFPGVIGRTADESTPAWPAPVRAREGAPNVLFIVLDDTGFGQLGCYGSPIATPSFDALAADGLRYSNMHTTRRCPALAASSVLSISARSSWRTATQPIPLSSRNSAERQANQAVPSGSWPSSSTASIRPTSSI